MAASRPEVDEKLTRRVGDETEPVGRASGCVGSWAARLRQWVGRPSSTRCRVAFGTRWKGRLEVVLRFIAEELAPDRPRQNECRRPRCLQADIETTSDTAPRRVPGEGNVRQAWEAGPGCSRRSGKLAAGSPHEVPHDWSGTRRSLSLSGARIKVDHRSDPRGSVQARVHLRLRGVRAIVQPARSRRRARPRHTRVLLADEGAHPRARYDWSATGLSGRAVGRITD